MPEFFPENKATERQQVEQKNLASLTSGFSYLRKKAGSKRDGKKAIKKAGRLSLKRS